MQNSIADRCTLADSLAASHPEHILLDRSETAVLMHTTARNLEELACKGDGPPVIRLGYRTVRYRASEVLDWLSGR